VSALSLNQQLLILPGLPAKYFQRIWA